MCDVGFRTRVQFKTENFSVVKEIVRFVFVYNSNVPGIVLSALRGYFHNSLLQCRFLLEKLVPQKTLY